MYVSIPTLWYWIFKGLQTITITDYRLKSQSEWKQACIFTLYYSIECYTVQITKPQVLVSSLGPSGHFYYPRACIYQSDVDYFAVESPTMVIFKFSIVTLRVFGKQNKKVRNDTPCKLIFCSMCLTFTSNTVVGKTKKIPLHLIPNLPRIDWPFILPINQTGIQYWYRCRK